MKVLYTGAEAEIIKVDENILKKIRQPKNYRIDILDKKLRRFRNKREFKILKKLHENEVLVPKPIDLHEDIDEELSIEFEYLKGDVLKKVLNKDLLILGFQEIIKMHNLDITHGDLTTLNMIYCNDKIYLIDFGLALFSNKAEDKAVDLNLFFTCIKNEHPDFYNMKNELELLYIDKANNSKKTIDRLKDIEKRGRNKSTLRTHL